MKKYHRTEKIWCEITGSDNEMDMEESDRLNSISDSYGKIQVQIPVHCTMKLTLLVNWPLASYRNNSRTASVICCVQVYLPQ